MGAFHLWSFIPIFYNLQIPHWLLRSVSVSISISSFLIRDFNFRHLKRKKSWYLVGLQNGVLFLFNICFEGTHIRSTPHHLDSFNNECHLWIQSHFFPLLFHTPTTDSHFCSKQIFFTPKYYVPNSPFPREPAKPYLWIMAIAHLLK